MASLQTGRTPEDRIEEEVRRRLVRRMSAAGLTMGAIANEVAYWLPTDFMRLYMEITEGALDIDSTLRSSMGRDVGDEGKATKAKVGTGPARGRGAGGLFTRTSGAHARGNKGGGGGRGPLLVKNDRLADLKARIDRRLVRVIAEEVRVYHAERAVEKGGGDPEEAREAGKQVRRAIDRARQPSSMGSVSTTHDEPRGVNHGGASGREGETHGENLMESFLAEREIEDLGTIMRCVTCKKITGKGFRLCPYTHKEG